MRSRLFAVIILLLFVGVPSYLYWWYYKKNISSLVFLIETKEPVTITLVGDLHYTYFPLLDRAFRYKSTCVGSCQFTPIPPLKYSITLHTEGREDIIDTIELHSSETKKYPIKLSRTLVFDRFATLPQLPNAFDMPGYEPIGITSHGKLIVRDMKQEGNAIGVINNNSFVSLFHSPTFMSGAYLDQSRSFVIIENTNHKQGIYPILGDLTQSIEFPYSDKVLFVVHAKNGDWKVSTDSGLYEFHENDWRKNSRFSDYIDLSEKYRLGFIDKSNEALLRLQNYPIGNSVMLLLDRTTADTEVIKKGSDVLGFFYYDDLPVYLDTSGDIYKISLRGSE